MTASAIGPLETETERARALVVTLSDEEWAASSGCAGWRVQDVVAHMACVFHQLADPASIETGTSDDVEVNAEVPVQAPTRAVTGRGRGRVRHLVGRRPRSDASAAGAWPR